MKDKIKNKYSSFIRWWIEADVSSSLTGFFIMAALSAFLGTFILLVLIYYATDGSGIYVGKPLIEFQNEMRKTIEVSPILMLSGPYLLFLAIATDVSKEMPVRRLWKYLFIILMLIFVAFSAILAVTPKLLTTEQNFEVVVFYCFVAAFLIIYCLKWMIKTFWDWLTDKGGFFNKVNNGKLKLVWTVIVTVMGWLLLKR